jgi:hypothetical protein
MRSCLVTVLLLAGCAQPPARVEPTASPVPSATAAPSPTANPADEYLVTLTGFRFAPYEGPTHSFLKELESGTLQDIVTGRSARSVRSGDEDYRVTVYVYALRVVAAGTAGKQEDIVERIAGSGWIDDTGLGGRTVAYIRKSSDAAYAWLQRTFFVVVVSEDHAHALTITRSLIDANTTEARFTITGQVTSRATGGPLLGVEVLLFKGGFAPCCDVAMPSVSTGITGRFSIIVPEGSYRIMFYPYGIDGYGVAWWKDGASFESATDLIVTKNIGQIDRALPAGHVVSGKVTSDYGGGLVGAHVDVFSADGGWVASTSTVLGGRYLVRLAPGQYRVYVTGPRGSELHGLWWPGETASDRSRLLGVPSKDSQQLDVELKGAVRSN